MIDRCFFCDEGFGELDPGAAPREGRVAFDPWLGRLWRVCPSCGRWSPVPLQDRWEALEACDRAAHEGKLLLQSDHLALLDVGGAQLVRIGEAPRVELSDWRYSHRLDAHPLRRTRRPGLVARLLAALPEPSAGGADYHGVPRLPPAEWIASPFQEHAGLLTRFFLRTPLAEVCPSCAGPLAVEPSVFGRIRLVREASGTAVVATCAFCGDPSAVPLAHARPALRAALGIVDRKLRDPEVVRAAAHALDRAGSAEAWLHELSGEELTLDAAEPVERLGLAIGLDEQAEAEALEAEWREAEELAAIMDGELSPVPGFSDFRDRVLEGEAALPREDDAD